MSARAEADEEGRNAMTAEQFCIAEAVRYAKSLSYCDCLRFLQGFVLIAGEANDAQPLREAIAGMLESDRQLELIAKKGRES
jgi:hypothetical protein